MAPQIDELCADLKNLCTCRDKIEMNSMKMDVDQIKRLSRYFIETTTTPKTKTLA